MPGGDSLFNKNSSIFKHCQPYLLHLDGYTAFSIIGIPNRVSKPVLGYRMDNQGMNRRRIMSTPDLSTWAQVS